MAGPDRSSASCQAVVDTEARRRRRLTAQDVAKQTAARRTQPGTAICRRTCCVTLARYIPAVHLAVMIHTAIVTAAPARLMRSSSAADTRPRAQRECDVAKQRLVVDSHIERYAAACLAVGEGKALREEAHRA
jgi:hypothetical protein